MTAVTQRTAGASQQLQCPRCCFGCAIGMAAPCAHSPGRPSGLRGNWGSVPRTETNGGTSLWGCAQGEQGWAAQGTRRGCRLYGAPHYRRQFSSGHSGSGNAGSRDARRERARSAPGTARRSTELRTRLRSRRHPAGRGSIPAGAAQGGAVPVLPRAEGGALRDRRHRAATRQSAPPGAAAAARGADHGPAER